MRLGNDRFKRVLSTLLIRSVPVRGTERSLSCFIHLFAVGRSGISFASAVVPGSIAGTGLLAICTVMTTAVGQLLDGRKRPRASGADSQPLGAGDREGELRGQSAK